VGSADLGGELGFTSGDSFPEEIEEVVAVLPLDGVSEAVSSDAGWHLFKVTEIRDGGVEDFAGVRMQLHERVARERAQRELIKVVEKLRDRAFNAEDLDGPAAGLGLEVAQAGPLTRSEPEGLFTHPQLVAAAFSDEVIQEGYNSEVIELGDSHFVALRVSNHIPPRLRDLTDVRDEVATRVADENARAEIEQQATDLLLRLREGATVEALALENGYDWQVELGARRDSRSVPPSLLRRAFKLPAGEEGSSAFEYVLNPDGDVELFELVRVMEGDAGQLPATRRVALQQNMMSELSRGTDNRFQQLLRDNADVTKI
jgi:peptidyl-prolyl cis-trans isomerase D